MPMILIIEDEPNVAHFVKKGLEENGFEAMVAYDGQMGLKLMQKFDFDVVLLDVILPGENGIEVCKKIRSLKHAVPILMLTALDATEDKVAGLDAGADDYLPKPFKFQELLARVRALSRRKHLVLADPILKMADLEVNTQTRAVARNGQAIELTPKEYQLLLYLFKNQNKVCSRTEIAEDVWGTSFDRGTNVVDVYINYLRNKIESKAQAKLIHTIFGAGYIFKVIS